MVKSPYSAVAKARVSPSISRELIRTSQNNASLLSGSFGAGEVSAVVVEHLLDAAGQGGHDGIAEQGVKPGQNEGADDHRHQDFHCGVHITLARVACQHTAGGSGFSAQSAELYCAWFSVMAFILLSGTAGRLAQRQGEDPQLAEETAHFQRNILQRILSRDDDQCAVRRQHRDIRAGGDVRLAEQPGGDVQLVAVAPVAAAFGFPAAAGEEQLVFLAVCSSSLKTDNIPQSVQDSYSKTGVATEAPDNKGADDQAEQIVGNTLRIANRI